MMMMLLIIRTSTTIRRLKAPLSTVNVNMVADCNDLLSISSLHLQCGKVHFAMMIYSCHHNNNNNKNRRRVNTTPVFTVTDPFITSSLDVSCLHKHLVNLWVMSVNFAWSNDDECKNTTTTIKITIISSTLFQVKNDS